MRRSLWALLRSSRRPQTAHVSAQDFIAVLKEVASTDPETSRTLLALLQGSAAAAAAAAPTPAPASRPAGPAGPAGGRGRGRGGPVPPSAPGVGTAGGAAPGDDLRGDVASVAGIDIAFETRALLGSRTEDVVQGGQSARETWMAATSSRLAARLLARVDAPPGASTAPLLGIQGVSKVTPAASEALTQAAVHRLTAVLEAVRDARDWRNGRGAAAGACPREWLSVPARSTQQAVWDINAREARNAEAREAAAREAALAAEEAALKKRKAAAGDGPMSEADQAHAAKVQRMRADEDARLTNAATASATRLALGGGAAVAGAAERWAAMERANAAAAAAGKNTLMTQQAQAQAQQAAAATAAAVVRAAAPQQAPALRGVGLRDVVACLQRDPRASPRLLGVAAERLRRAEQHAAGGLPASATLLAALTPKYV